MTSRTSRQARQTHALVQLLKALPEAQLVDVLAGVEARLASVAPPATKKTSGRICLTCGLSYPEHMRRWGEDHPFDRPKREKPEAPA